jgi:Bacterial regulatory proteins, luxR family
LQRLKLGESNKTIPRALGIRDSTVKVYVRQLMHKFGVDNRTKLVVARAVRTEYLNSNVKDGDVRQAWAMSRPMPWATTCE